MKRDKIHYSFRHIMGYPQPFKFVISPREPGKSTSAAIELALGAYLQGGITVYLKRQEVDITSAYLDSFENMINKFDDVPHVHLTYLKSQLKDGIVSIYDQQGDQRKLFMVVIALSLPVQRLKSLCFPGLRYMIMDEFICNPKYGEKYLPGEFGKWQELYNTLQRESKRLRMIWLGNPYSLYNPYFSGFGIPTKSLKPGTIFTHNNCVVECYQLTQELREWILKNNPLYEFDDSYRAYAFDGQAVNDQNIQIVENVPKNFSLKFIFMIGGKYIGVYRGDLAENIHLFWCSIIEDFSSRRTALCFDFDDLQSRCALLSRDDRIKFARFKMAMRSRCVAFNNIECYYLIVEIYNNI